MSSDRYTTRPDLHPKPNEMRKRLLAVPDGKALILKDELERRKASNAFSTAALKKEWKVHTVAQTDGTFLAWVEKRGDAK